MTNKNFIDKIRAAYEKAHNLYEGDAGFNIKRGMAHSISGYVEDLFAVYMAKIFNKKHFQYLVDKVISIRLNQDEKAKSFKPDLMVIDEKVITHYFDLKTNLGWNRELEKYLNAKDKFIESIKGKKAWITYSNKPTEHITISKDIKYRMVVVFGWNINHDLLKANIKLAKSLKHVEIYVLYSKENKEDEFAINEQEFDRLIKDSKPGL